MNIRTAERRDLSAMLDIYNYEVKNGTATFDVEPRAGAAGEAWFAAHNTGNHPLLVAEEDGKVLRLRLALALPATSTPICKPLSFPFTSRPRAAGAALRAR